MNTKAAPARKARDIPAWALRMSARMDELGLSIAELLNLMIHEGFRTEDRKSTEDLLSKWKNGWVKKPRDDGAVEHVAKVLGLGYMELMHGPNYAKRTQSVSPPELAPPSNIGKSAPFDVRRAALPIRGRSMAGKDGVLDFSSGEVLGWIDTTEKLSGVPDAYAVYVVGDSMFPALRNGWVCQVNPYLPPAKDQLVVVQVTLDDGASILGYVKELVHIDDKVVKLAQYNPKKVFTFPRKQVVSIHRVMMAGPSY